MTDPRFFGEPRPISVADLAQALDARIHNPASLPTDRLISAIAPIDRAATEAVSFVLDRARGPALASSQAGAVLVTAALADQCPQGTIALVCEHPQAAFARATELIFPDPIIPHSVSASAHIGAGTTIDETASVAAGVWIGDGVEIGAHTRIEANAVIGNGVRIGADCRIGPQVSIAYALLGDRVRILAGARIGERGFGFAHLADGTHVPMPHRGRVVIEDDVEIGANTCIDRGSLDDTTVGRGAVIDDLVMIGHNCTIGSGVVIAAQVGLSGSTTLERFAMIGGQAGFAGHLVVGAGARVGAKAGVMRDIPPKQAVMGYPAISQRLFWRQVAALKRLVQRKEADN